MNLQLEFRERPSIAAYMLRAFYPSLGLRKANVFPPISARWIGHRVDRPQFESFLELTGLRAGPGLPMLYPHVFGFPLQMVILTHPRFPMPIWGALQIRNHLLQHRTIAENAVIDIHTRVADQRILDKGAEVDLHTTVHAHGELAWESLNTFYYRGRFGKSTKPSALAVAPNAGETVIATWRSPSAIGLRFGGFTGDYNGIHCWDGYARIFGFRRAFHHPQCVLAQCMAHLPAPAPNEPQRLDAWLKGPVHYDSELQLRAAVSENGATFAVVADREQRPAIVGRWHSVPASERL